MSEEKSGEKKMLPTTVNMMKKLWTTTHGVVVHKQKFDILSFVGRVAGVNDSTTKCAYVVDDGTDCIDVLVWKGADDSKAKTLSETIGIGTYVRCYGQIRNQNNTLNFVAFKVDPIKDFNEVTEHAMEVVRDNLLLRKIKFLHLATRGDPTANTILSGLSGSGGATPMDIGDTGSSNLPSGMNKAQTLILETLNKCQVEEGMSREELAGCLPTLDSSTLNGSLDWLANEGHIFTTLNEHHFRSAY
ncbi:replication protein A 32 kDa subunit-B-like [Panonychus citri]|uniref:replication protein A 32 kDa subunit-B-like n=1 Tax=Panonychus citri TaxID=50023 RepID=UPI0023075C5B|nr:replication protein A 32 kDa subunit-B-like [Panonychus citri]